ncbi:potassium-transporting ATPase subunit KdpC [Kitasatospora purpeofusca]|uniref:potassium-transporting ATPase subunit KdpC n=1 Tax=Kitasatospora purpeofusca TaxID=67352 RepID=UPI00225783D1|nr:potassium-transporting ATPase subunit KdpC [Kitasatospora purpeofusca]MCX4758602.1 potassium-transporting ATPase subunit KdpC [Kitasatospora purpeofusca]WSR30957.1 potassium-transporting ATPase subunit KdpC [Kitasatospora purpeofusca]
MSKPLPTTVRTHFTALRMLLVMTVILGLAYPLLITGISQVAFTDKANGSIVKADGKEAGSSLLGQNFNLPKQNPDDPDEEPKPDPKWFQPRFSAGNYDPKSSGATNLGPNDEKLTKAIQDRRAAIAAFDGVDAAGVPADAVTSSASGLDPHISVAYAREQVNRVARERGIPTEKLNQLIDHYTDTRALGFLGQDGVNIVLLNKAVSEAK